MFYSNKKIIHQPMNIGITNLELLLFGRFSVDLSPDLHALLLLVQVVAANRASPVRGRSPPAQNHLWFCAQQQGNGRGRWGNICRNEGKKTNKQKNYRWKIFIESILSRGCYNMNAKISLEGLRFCLLLQTVASVPFLKGLFSSYSLWWKFISWKELD